MTLNSLNAIIDDIMLTIRNSNISESENISRYQIEQWIHQYRAKLIKEDLDKGRLINPFYIQTIRPFHISKMCNCANGFQYRSDDPLPKFIDLHFGIGLVAIKDMEGNIIQLGNETKAKLQTSRKYTCNDYIAYIKGKYLYIMGPEHLEWVSVEGILEDPTSACTCFDMDDTPYPIPANMLPVLKELIFDKELKLMIATPTDTSNNSANDVKQDATD